MGITRRDFIAASALSGLVSASVPLFAKRTDALVVPLGMHTFSFHEIMEGGMPAVDEILADTRRLGLNSVELFAPQLSPFPMPEGFYKRWRRQLIQTMRLPLLLWPRLRNSVERSCGNGASMFRRITFEMYVAGLLRLAWRSSRSTSASMHQ